MDTTTIGPRPGRGVLILIALIVVLASAVFGVSRAMHAGAETALERVVDVPGSEAMGPDPTAPPPDLAAIPGGTADWWSTVTASIAREEYKFTVAEAGLQAPNRAQNFRSRYRETNVELEPRERSAEEAPAWRMSWRTKAWGRPGAMSAVGGASPEVNAEGTRITYRHEGMSEWYENRKEGLEQGFTVAERPAGAGPLRIEGEFTGTARPVLREDGAIDLLDENSVALVRYGELAVRDAAGADVPASLAVAGNTVAIVVEDDNAEYPLIVDPLMTTPAWIVESNHADAWFGYSVSTAGDVNGDDYSDVIVGAPNLDNGNEQEGRVYAYHGSASGLATTPAWTKESNVAFGILGVSVSTAGDINRDGYDDVILGGNNRAFVYFGSPGGLSASPAWTAQSNQTNSGFGWSVGTAGDVNGDGFPDVIVGAPDYTNPESREGRAYVYHGSPSGPSMAASWTAESNQSGANFGEAVAMAGDINGDRFSDVVVGAPYYANGENAEGRAFVYHGAPAGLAGTPSWTAESNRLGASFGASVSTAGDVNGDGYSDIVIGARWYSNPESTEGRAYVYHGTPAGLAGTPAWTAESNQTSCEFGESVATAGDVNGDGYSDVIVGAWLFENGDFVEGAAFVYHGSVVGLAPTATWTVESNVYGATFGGSVSSAGDVNGDGFSDVIIGAESYTNSESVEGRASVYHGSAAGLSASARWTAESNQAGANFGISVSTADDVNGDGISDVLVGAYHYDNGETDEGRVYAYLGSASGPGPTPIWTAESNQAGSGFGLKVSTAGDVNGDGYSDVIIGAPYYDNGQTDEGRAYIYHGRPTGIFSTAARILEANQALAHFGISVASAGNVNRDAYSDVIIGAWHYANGQANEGRAFAYHGSATGIGTAAAWTAESNQADAWFGHPVASAGDVNGDNYSDVIVGSAFFDNFENNEGRAFVYHGSATGLRTTASWTGESNQAGADFGFSADTAGDVNGDGYSDVIVGIQRYNSATGRAHVYHGSASGLAVAPSWIASGTQAAAWFGNSVGTAGDVNGDGYSDVLVAADRYDNGQAEEGRVYAYHGSATGLGPSPAWTAESNQAGTRFGYAVSTAGDVNGDNYSDVIIGAPYYDNGATDEGRAFIYFGNEASRLIRPRSVRVVDSTPIAPLGRSDSPSAFRLEAIGLSPMGRARVWLEYEVEKFGTPFDGLDLELGPVTDTGFPQNLGSAVVLLQSASGLIPDTSYHWRVRVASDSPFFPHSRWVSPLGNAPSEADLFTAEGPASVATSPEVSGQHLLLGAGNPNPFTASTEFEYSVPQAGRLQLKVYSVTGREVVALIDQVQAEGSYHVRWDGRDREGQLLPAGVYFARLELGDRVESQKLVLAR